MSTVANAVNQVRPITVATLSIHVQYDCKALHGKCLIKVGAIDAAALGPFKK